MNQLVSYHLLFHAEVVTPLELDDHSGSALRGNLYEAVWTRFCTNKASATCAACELHTLCPVSALVAPLREESARGRDTPRPYLILPPLGAARRYEPGSTFSFGLTLFGSIVELLPYIMLSIKTLEDAGLGKKVFGPQGQGGQRGRFVVTSVETYHPISGERQRLYEKGRPVAGRPALAVTPEDVRTKAASLPTDRLTLTLLTPMRLVDRERLVHRAEFRPLIQRLLERQLSLEDAYGREQSEKIQISKARNQANETTPNKDSNQAHETASNEGPEPPEKEDRHTRIQRLLEQADKIECVDDATSWDDLTSYSRRLKRSTPLGGLIGSATFAGDLTAFRELLVWGEIIHVGKSCVKGNGWYTIKS